MSISKPWHVLTLSVGENETDQAIALISESNPNGIQEERTQDGRTLLRAYFTWDTPDLENLQKNLIQAISGSEAKLALAEWDSTDQSWRQYFTPFEIVPHLVVSPTWEYYQPKVGQTVITIDPGMAFGTGLHPTTRLCAQAIHKITGSLGKQSSLLDVGCGSGLLSLVGDRLGIQRIAAVEIDPIASEIARRNFISNGNPTIPVFDDILQVKDTFKLVVANILLNTLLSLRDDLTRVTASGGYLVLSGVTEEQADELSNAYSSELAFSEMLSDDEWRCLIFCKNV